MQLKVSFQDEAPFSVSFSSTQTLTEKVDRYAGEYIIIPKADEAQILPTKDLIMTDDLTVTKVPYFETSNSYGETIYIASEV